MVAYQSLAIALFAAAASAENYLPRAAQYQVPDPNAALTYSGPPAAATDAPSDGYDTMDPYDPLATVSDSASVPAVGASGTPALNPMAGSSVAGNFPTDAPAPTLVTAVTMSSAPAGSSTLTLSYTPPATTSTSSSDSTSSSSSSSSDSTSTSAATTRPSGASSSFTGGAAMATAAPVLGAAAMALAFAF